MRFLGFCTSAAAIFTKEVKEIQGKKVVIRALFKTFLHLRREAKEAPHWRSFLIAALGIKEVRMRRIEKILETHYL